MNASPGAAPAADSGRSGAFWVSALCLVALIALGIPGIFTGAIITEQIFRVNGLGDLLIRGIYNSDIPMVQTITFMFAVLIVVFNILADVAYGVLDPRIRYG